MKKSSQNNIAGHLRSSAITKGTSGFQIAIETDCEFKSRDITLPTKVHIVKVMDFLVVMYGCESWTTKKAELIMLN